MTLLLILLIALNLVVSYVAFSAFRKQDRPYRFLLIPYEVARGQNYEGLLLSNFSHADGGHLLFNMITLFFFFGSVEAGLGLIGALLVYVVAGILSSLVVIYFQRNNPSYRALGASGSVSGIVFASIVLQPYSSIYLFFVPIPIPAPIFAVAYLAVSTLLLKKQVGNISHEAHVGGALAGFFMAGLMSPRGFTLLVDALLALLPWG